jgi:hypothetical protein
MALNAQQITASQVVVTLPSVVSPSIGNAITSIIICNSSASVSDTVTVWAVPSGSGSPSSSNMIINALPVPATETVSLDQEKLVLGTGDAIWVQAGATSILSIVVSTIPV